jgi:hypothetical protein
MGSTYSFDQPTAFSENEDDSLHLERHPSLETVGDTRAIAYPGVHENQSGFAADRTAINRLRWLDIVPTRATEFARFAPHQDAK